MFIVRGEIEYLQRYVADQNQYLEVKYRDGRKVNEPGCVCYALHFAIGFCPVL